MPKQQDTCPPTVGPHPLGSPAVLLSLAVSPLVFWLSLGLCKALTQ